MKLIPLSLPITIEIPVYKNKEEKRPYVETTRNFESNGMHESTLHIPLHTGTHVDYPLHAIEHGKTSSDFYIFPAIFNGYVLDLSMKSTVSIGLDQVQAIDFYGVDAFFIKTIDTPAKSFDFEFPWLEGEAAAWLSGLPLKFVGIDQLGIERNQPNHETHINLLQKDILIIEGLNLSELKEGIHEFLASTLQIKNVEAEPIMIYAVEK